MTTSANYGTPFLWAFTVTLHPNCYRMDPLEQFQETDQKLINKLKADYDTRITFLAETTQNDNIHYHGIISYPSHVKDPKRIFYNSFRQKKNEIRIFGHVNIKQVTEYRKWVEYILKDTSAFIRRFERSPLVTDEHNVVIKQAHDAEYETV